MKSLYQWLKQHYYRYARARDVWEFKREVAAVKKIANEHKKHAKNQEERWARKLSPADSRKTHDHAGKP